MTCRSNVFTKHPDLKYDSLLQDTRVLGVMIDYRGGAVKIQDESARNPILQTSTHKMMGCVKKKKEKKIEELA